LKDLKSHPSHPLCWPWWLSWTHPRSSTFILKMLTLYHKRAK
jgi:hypothetical protein